MIENVLSKTIKNIDPRLLDKADEYKSLIVKQLSFNTNGKIYSYIVYGLGSIDAGWRVEFLISQTDELNTLDIGESVDSIFDLILKDTTDANNSRVLGFKQPPIAIMLRIYDPLIKKLAKEQQSCWTSLEYEDLYQTCGLVICTLYNKGYYIHKSLVRKSFINEVLLSIKHDRYKPVMVSMDECIKNSKDESILVRDTVADVQQEESKIEQDEQEIKNEIFREFRELIVEMIGERQYDQLLREYGAKSTTSWSRKLVESLKEQLKKEGITLSMLYKRYI